jgi:hypothetical protein
VPGNHDLPFEFAPNVAASMAPKNVIFLEKDGVTLNSVRFYAFPVRRCGFLKNPPCPGVIYGCGKQGITARTPSPKERFSTVKYQANIILNLSLTTATKWWKCVVKN